LGGLEEAVMLLFRDISQYQGAYDMAADPNPIVMIKMSGGDGPAGAELYFDSQAYNNYTSAVSAGKAPGGYHFAGGGDPIAEADYFYRAMSPLAENDVMALDWEDGNYTGDPVAWCLSFVTEIHNKCGVWPLLYINISTLNAHKWGSVLATCGLWLAAPSYGFDQIIPEVKAVYMAQQGPIANGVDTDAFFGTLDEWKAYGYHQATTSSPTPNPQPSVPPTSLESPVTSTVPPTIGSTSSVSAPSAAPTTTGSTAKTSSSPPTTPLAIDIVKPKSSSKPSLASTKSEAVVVESDIKKDEDAIVKIAHFLKGKKTYTVGTLMLFTSAEKYFTGDHTLSQYLTTVQGLMGSNGLAVIALRAAVAKLD
jgi:hypothetical protein